jgi:stage IV sporulation protein A
MQGLVYGRGFFMNGMNEYDLYTDIRERCGGEIYIGVLGPVRTGKSTFIKRFMEELVLPYMEDENEKARAVDELPQSAGGKTITTTEPKFIPSDAADIKLDNGIEFSVRLIDCVGYMVDGAAGHMEEDEERMVKTPWSDKEIPFTKAAETGTDKVMNEHSTIGLVVTTDGSIGELQRSNYLDAEDKTITAMKKTGKPFIVLVNSKKPYSEDAKKVTAEIAEKYNVSTMAVNCEQLKKDDINNILERVLYEFPLSSIEFYIPKWVELLPDDDNVKADIIEKISGIMAEYDSIRDVINKPLCLGSEYIKRCKTDNISLYDGTVKVQLDADEKYYYQMLSALIGEDINDEYSLIQKLKELAGMKQEYSKVQNAVNMVRIKGYGVVTPDRDEIVLDKPEVIKHGSKYGVKIKATSPSIHMIKANIETEIAPIVGTKEQAEDLITYIEQADASESIWDTNIFGKTIEQLVNDGISSKVSAIGEESQVKLQDSMQKIVNDINGGMVCIII